MMPSSSTKKPSGLVDLILDDAAKDQLRILEGGTKHEFVAGRCAHCTLTEDEYTDALIFSADEIACPRPCSCDSCVGIQHLRILSVASVILIGILMLVAYAFGWRLA